MPLPGGVRTYELECRFEEPIAVHVVETASHTVLFGGGDESTRDRYAEIVAEEEPDVIVVEHGDPDHYGSLPAVAGPDAPTIAVPAGDADFLREADVEPDVLLEAGTERWGIETIGAPGHTPDNMAYRIGAVLVAGDTVAGADSAFAAGDDWSGPLAVITDGYNHDDALTRESVGRLLEHDVDVVLVTHGSNVEEGGSEAIETLIDDLSVGTAS